MSKNKVLCLLLFVSMLGVFCQSCARKEQEADWESYIGQSVDEIQENITLVQDEVALCLYHTAKYEAVGELALEVLLETEEPGGVCNGYRYLWTCEEPSKEDLQHVKSMYQALLERYGEPDSADQKYSLLPHLDTLDTYVAETEGQDQWSVIDEQSGLGMSVSITRSVSDAENQIVIWIQYRNMMLTD